MINTLSTVKCLMKDITDGFISLVRVALENGLMHLNMMISKLCKKLDVSFVLYKNCKTLFYLITELFSKIELLFLE